MYESLGYVQLKTGERVEAAAVTGPDPEWASRVLDLLGHKEGVWTEQNRQAITTDLGIDVHFYLLHRDNVPFANVTVTDFAGVGILGHVYTVADDRRKGAASLLFDKLMGHVRGRDCKALYLCTEYESPAYRLYERYGFRGIEPNNGAMEWYAASRGRFDQWYFADGPAQIELFAWAHWPAASPLTMGPWPGMVRCAPQAIYGRMISENALLPLVMDNCRRADNEQPPRGVALVKPDTGAVVGLAAWTTDDQPGDACLVDVYCHPQFWSRAGDLLDALSLPDGCAARAQADDGFEPKRDALVAAGFKQVGRSTRQSIAVLTFEKA
jgi:GNAT superfamily N-acetyltransferase